jgi:hypothetical protein
MTIVQLSSMGHQLRFHDEVVTCATFLGGVPCGFSRSVDQAAAATYPDADSYVVEGVLASIALGRLLRLAVSEVSPSMKAIQGTSTAITALPHKVYVACFLDHFGRIKDAFQVGESHVSCVTFYLATAAEAAQLKVDVLAFCAQHVDRLPTEASSSHSDINKNGSVITTLRPAAEAGIKWIQSSLLSLFSATAWADLSVDQAAFQAECRSLRVVAWVHNPHMMVHPATTLWSLDDAYLQEVIQVRDDARTPPGGSLAALLRDSFRLRLLSFVSRGIDPRMLGLSRFPADVVFFDSP